jgi:hypothetical protein
MVGDQPITCIACGDFLAPDDVGIFAHCKKHRLCIHTREKCEHAWDKEVTADRWSSKQCSKCFRLAIDEDMAG